MSFIRPELKVTLTRYREVIVCGALVIVGLWLALTGTSLARIGIGAAMAFAGGALGIAASQRMRFRSEREAPGVVIVDERRVGYFGAETGGFVETGDLASVEVCDSLSGRVWRLSDRTGQTLEIPVGAKGAEGLFDVFESLPGFPMERALVSSRDARGGIVALWRTD